MSAATHPDPSRVVCAGDWLTAHRKGATEALERLCRIDEPELAWKFWHLGDSSTTATELLQEAIWKALGLGAGRLVLSLGGTESTAEGFDTTSITDGIRQCLRLLADKGPPDLVYILPCPSLWPLARRPLVEELRQALQTPVDRWKLVDLEPRASQFLEAQSRHPDHAAALVEDGEIGPSLTGLGALLVADELRKAMRG